LYSTDNTLNLHYKDHFVNCIEENNAHILGIIHNIYIFCMYKIKMIMVLKLVTNRVTNVTQGNYYITNSLLNE